MIAPNGIRDQAGFSMIEVLITLVILVVGLLGLAGLILQSQRSEMESYQRVQALTLLQDIISRMNANRKAATCYQFTTPTNGAPYLGTGSAVAAPTVASAQCSAATVQAVYPTLPAPTAALAAQTAVADMNAWHNALLGAAELQSTSKVGGMINARGCISYDAAQELVDPITLNNIAGSGVYTLSVAWQGLGDTFANGSQLCGTGQYGPETRRRVVALTMRIANLK